MPSDLADDRADDGFDVDAVVIVEALIFDRDERLRHVGRQRFEWHVRAEFVTDFTDERAVAREDERRLRQGNDLPRFARLVGGILRRSDASRDDR